MSVPGSSEGSLSDRAREIMARVDAQAAAVSARPLDSLLPSAIPPRAQPPAAPAPPAYAPPPAPNPTPGLPDMASGDEVDRLVTTIVRGLGAARAHLIELSAAIERADAEINGTLRRRPPGYLPGLPGTPPR